MASSVSEILLSQFSQFVSERVGLHFPKDRWLDLERGIRLAHLELGFGDVESCVRWLLSASLGRRQLEILASHLTVGETYFYREKRGFEMLEDRILPELIRARGSDEKRLRIWSAGCCTGEEPYSIAMSVDKTMPDWGNWNLSILGTDINPRFLKKALEGTYNEWSFRESPDWIKEKYFTRMGKGRYEIVSHIRNMATFSYLNLAEDVYPSFLNNTNAMDIIFCRNVLMYFEPNQAKKVVRNFYRALLDGGWLIVSPVEISHDLFSEFAVVKYADMTFYKKDSRKAEGEGRRAKGEGRRAEGEEAVLLREVPDYQMSFSSLDELQKSDLEAALTEEVEDLTTLESLKGDEKKSEDDAEAIMLLAKVYANQGRLSEAIDWCKKAISADKVNPSYRYFYAVILQEQGQTEEASVLLKQAIYLDPNFVLAHFALGNLALQQGKKAESRKHFENVLSLLKSYHRDEALLESEGMTAGRLAEVVRLVARLA